MRERIASSIRDAVEEPKGRLLNLLGRAPEPQPSDGPTTGNGNGNGKRNANGKHSLAATWLEQAAGSSMGEELLTRATEPLCWAALQAMGLALRFKPGLAELLWARRPDGQGEAFEARFIFGTKDGEHTVSAEFSGGRLRPRRGALDDPHVRVRFQDAGAMREFFKPGGDPLNMLLDNRMAFEGNLATLARFGHISTAVTVGTEPLPLTAKLAGPARWQDLQSPAAGEPCTAPFDAEASHVDEPFLSQWTLDDFPSLKRLLWAHRMVQPEVCVERSLLLTEHKLSASPRPATPGRRSRFQAEALNYVLCGKQAIIHDDDLLAGTTTAHRIGVLLFPETGATAIWPELVTVQGRDLNPYGITAQDAEILHSRVFPFWEKDNIREWARTEYGNPPSMQLDERFVLYFLWKNFAISHTVADMPSLLERGLADIAAEALRHAEQSEDDDQAAFYTGLSVALEGVMDYARRLAERAERLAVEAPDAARAAKLRQMAATCRQVPAGPARTLEEAVQAVWIVFLCLHQENFNAGLSFGRLDVWFEPYFQRDLAGITDPKERERAVHRAVELVGGLMLKATDHLPLVPDIGNRLFGGSSSDQVITLGGVDAAGATAVGDMTWIFLKAVEMLRLRDPNVNARYAPGVNSEAYLRRLCELNLLTRATPSIHNDEEMVPALQKLGFTAADARDWSATGCVEPTSCGRHYGHTGCIMFNLVAPLEMALNDGLHPLLDEQIGPHTGDPRRFDRYEQVWEAFTTQLGFMIDRVVEGNNLLGETHRVMKPTPLLSAVFQGPMAAGKDLIEGGATYNTTGTAMVALTDIIDSLAAIKTLVLERGELDLATLLAALEADFEGHESVLQLIDRHAPRFGTGAPLTAEIADQVMTFIAEHLATKTNYRGGAYLPGYWSMSNHVAFGLLSGALPSGRRRGESFTPGLTPSARAAAPLTEQIRAVAELDTDKLPNNCAFNIKLVPGAQDQHQQMLDRMSAYVQAYTDMGGLQLQFNVVSTETLRQAMARPEDFRDLLVRVSGYNAYFVELNADMQKELIERMEHTL